MRKVTKHLPAEERRAVTVDTVIRLAAEHNPSEITTAAIAEKMNLTQGALFRHFPGKAAIWEAVMRWVSDQLLAKIERATRDTTSPLASLEAMFLAHIDFVVARPGVPRMLFGELQRAEDTTAKQMVRTLLGRYGERLEGIIESGKAQGELRADVDTSSAAALFIGAIQGLVVQSLLTGNPQYMCEAAPGVFAVYRHGIEVSP